MNVYTNHQIFLLWNVVLSTNYAKTENLSNKLQIRGQRLSFYLGKITSEKPTDS